MSDLYTLKRDLNRYYDLRDSIKKVINYLRIGIEKLELATKKNTLYSIDDIPADQNIIKNEMSKLIAKKEELNNKVIPEINSQIYILKKQIQEEEANPVSDSGAGAW